MRRYLAVTLQLYAMGSSLLQRGLVKACFLGFAGCGLCLQVPYLGSDAVDLRHRARVNLHAGRSILCHCRPAHPSIPQSSPVQPIYKPIGLMP